jgi:hypothetical protein
VRNERTDGTDSRADVVDGDRDVVAGGEAPRSRRVFLVCTALAALLVAQPLWHAVAPHNVSPRGADGAPSASGRRGAPHESVAAAATSTPYHQSVMRPIAHGRVRAFLQWYDALPVATRAAPRSPSVSAVFRVQHSASFTSGEDFSAVAQVRGRDGWTSVAHGDIRDARVDADGRRVAFIVVAASRTDFGIQTVRTWAVVVSVSDGLLTATWGVPPQASVSGWFGDQVVIARSAIGLAPLLIDAGGRRAPRELATGSVAVGDSVGDVEFLGPDLDHCLTGWRLGLAPRTGNGRCPDDALVAASPDGRWAVTRDQRWLARASGRSTAMMRRPPGWPVDSVDFVDARRARVVVRLPGRLLVALCSRQAGCTRPR